MDHQQQCRQHLASLLQILSEESSRSDLSQKLRSDASAKEGLEVFYSIIRRGVDASSEGLVKLELQSWSESQIQAVVSTASAIAAATRSLSVEEVEPLLLAVVQIELEFALCCLDNSTYIGDDFSVQNNLVLLLEMLLADTSEKLPFSLEPLSVDGILECLVTIVGDSVGAKVDKHIKRNQQGCSRQEKTAEHLLMTLAAEYVHPGNGMSGLTRSSFHQNVDHLVFTCQHWAVADLGCVRRLVVLCKDLARLPSDETAALNNLCRRVSFSTKIIKLLGNLLLDMPFVEYETGLLEACISYAEALPSLLKIKLEFVNNNTSSEGSLENLILLLLEEFVHLLQLLFHRSSAFQNLQASIAASILDSLAPTEWTYDKSATTVKLPLAYFPRSVLYMLKLLNELSLHTICGSDLKDSENGGLSNFPSCSVHLQKIPLVKRHTVEELMKMMFPVSGQWLDNLIFLIFILYTEGVKSGQKVERSYLTKASCQDAENATSHEEEALFGDLFSEGSRSAGSTDDQLAGAVSSSNCNMYIQAATELLSFLNQCIFSPEWHPSVFRNAREKLNQGHVDILLSIVSGLINNSGDVVPISSNLSQEEGKFGHVRELCFALLHKLLTMEAFSASLEDHLVQLILKVENGMFAYNAWTLTLLADTLFSRMGSKGSQLRTKIYKDFITFIVEKVRIVCSGSPSLKELVATLPAILHVEILLMAFHLSSETEKKQLAVLVFASITEITSPAMDFSGEQLSCWALLVSRLILLLRHMLFHPSTCPPTLLLGLRTKLRGVLVSGPHLSDNNMATHLVSWVSTALKSVSCSFGIEESPINMLINHLIDTVALPVSLRRDDPSVDSPCLTWTDVHEAFSRILGIWTQKKAGSAGDLIMERYIFSLCWDIPTVVQPLDQSTLWNRSEDLVLSDMGKFFQLSHAVLGNYDAVKSIECYDIVWSVLEQFQCIPLSEDPELPNWDFFRSGMWLSLVLPTLNAGVKDDRAKNGKLMKILSSSLTRSLRAFHLAFISTFKRKNCSECNFSPLLLLVHSRFDQQIQGELIEKSGISSSMLEYVTQFLVKLDLAVEKRSPDSSSKFLWELLFHGLPLLLPSASASVSASASASASASTSASASASAILLSSILSIRGIVCSLNGIMRSKDASGDVFLESEVVHQIVDSILSVKFNRIFVSLQDKCDIILSSLSMGYEGTDQASLFALKQMEGFLLGVSAGVSDTSIFSWVVDKYVDIIDDLKRDPSKCDSLQFYLRPEISTRQVPYGLHHGDLMILIDSLDNCCSESVNVKVFNFFVDVLMGNLCPDLKQRLQSKFLGMDLFDLSKWLEKRLLSCTGALDAMNSAKGSSTALRDSTMSFLLCLTSDQRELPSSELHGRIFEALLISLDAAFSLFDIQVARSYFQFVIQFVRGRSSVRLLLEKTIMLMEELAGDDRAIPGLRFIFSFLGTFLKDFGSYKNPPGESLQKSLSGGSAALGHALLKAVGSRKTSDSLVLTGNHESASASLECDATSIDEDEDDGTSDGDVASIDKDEEEDANSERALASKVCTFTSSGSNFMEQHWYFCYTCDLTVSKGCCSVCAKVCHRGHRVVYSRSSRFFCDCGAGGVRGSNCQCLKPRKFTGSSTGPVSRSSNLHSLLPLSEEGNQIAESDTDLDDDLNVDGESSLSLPLTRDVQDGIPEMLEELDLEGRVLHLCETLLPSVTSGRDLNISKDKKISLGQDMVMSYGIDVLQLKKAYKSGSLDLKIKADYSNSKELKAHLNSGSLVKSLLSVNARGRLAVGEGDKVAIFDVGQLIGQATVAPVTADKTNVKPLSKNVVRFEIVHLTFNVQSENYLAVAGYEDCQVLTLNSRGEVTDRLAIELALQGAYIRRVEWVPGSQVQLLVVTNKFVKIYDLSQDNISPMHYLTLADDLIVDGTISMASHRKMFLVVLSDRGILYRLELLREGNVGATPLKEVIKIQGKEVKSRGLSLYFSPTYKLLFLSYHDGTTLIGQLSPDATSFVDLSPVYEEEQEVKLRPAGLHHWKELLPGTGLFSCISSVKSNSALAVCIGARDLNAQSIRHALGSTAPLVGITAYKPLSKEKVHCLVLHEDGSLQIYSYANTGGDAGANTASEKIKKLSTGILSNKAYTGVNPEFPLDFFEKAICITADVKLGGDTIRNGDFEGAKQSLASDDGYLESPSASGFKISVSNSNPDIVMVGFRVHVGNTSPNHIPSNLTIFQRVIKLDEGMRSWYDVPFTIAESLLSDEEFVVTIGPTFNGSLLSRIDSLEIYGRSKDEFGWKEKMDAVLDMEARLLGKSLLAGSARKHRSVQSAPLQEQVVADALKLLSKFYVLCRGQQCSRVEDPSEELKKLKCKQILDKVFESDREPLLQAAACRILQSLFPKKEIYYQVKDTMRLLGVVKSAAFLSARLVGGGASGSWIIEEFTAQMHVVSKIALHRRSNLANFLEMNGSEVVDGLMQVLWGILDMEQPDAQTMNNIVISSVELIYCYAECLALHGKDSGERSVAPAVTLLKQLLFSPNDAIQNASSLAISSRLLQVPFPRQTASSTEDAADIAIPSAASVEAASTNARVMIEEDSITSSVQYCCDGCSTVPIQRRRWHCTVCPDFDLCEACYEVLSDQLPLPHSKDHPMTAIPIEVESLGTNVNDINYVDDVTETVFSGRSDVRPRNSAPSIHILEPNASGEFSSSVVDSVLISASKKEVNSLLLSELLEQLRGWMETTSGVRAIPVMQLFYRLSSAVNGPFIGSSKPESMNLEKLINWFLKEIKIDKPFIASSRSSFGEVAVLVFMFFTLMLRNWHQPGSDSSSRTPSGEGHERSMLVVAPVSSDDHGKSDFASQLLLACNSLRQQPFINYLMDILQQLVHVFKSSTDLENSHGTGAGSGCGALLSVRRDFSAGNFSPFFSDSYVKSHHADIFTDYHRLLLENAFRLLYALIRPEKQDKTGEKEKVSRIITSKDLKLDGYQDVLCSYINNSQTSFVRRYARRLFLHLCGSKTHYYSVRDAWQFSSEVKRLYKHVDKSGGFQNPVSYERSVKIVKCLSTMAEVAAARPRNWQKYCLRHGDVLPFLLDGVFYFGEESVFQTLKLINLAFFSGNVMQSPQKVESGDSVNSSSKSTTQFVDAKKKKKGEDANDSASEKSYMDMEAAVEIFTDKGCEMLTQFIDCFLLEWNSSSVRSEARSVLYGIWHHGKQSVKETLFSLLLQRVDRLPVYGQNVVEYTELVTWLLGRACDTSSKTQTPGFVERCLTPDIIKCIFQTLHFQNELLANHPNSRIYNTLSGLVDFDGYYLESEPCVTCSSPEVPYSRMKLESLKSETKFTDRRIIVKCTGSYTIQTVTMNVHDARRSKSVKVLNLYYNNRPVTDLSELKNNWTLWKRAKSCHLAFNQTELKVEFPIPITACNFMIELDSFYENLQALSLEPLQCPRCSRPVTDKHGICSNCHENAYQCRQCRNINYENLDSFLCNECGYSKYGRFEFNFMAKPSFSFDDMENDDDMKRGLAAIESESENAHRRYQQLLGFKKPLLKIVSSIGENEMDSQQKDSVQQMMVSLPGPSCKINRKIALLGVLYGEKCKAAFDSVSKSVQTLQGLRRVLMNYLHHKNSDSTEGGSRFVVSRSPSNCYGCASTFVTQCLDMLHALCKHPAAKKQLVAAGILSELFENNIHQGPRAARVQARTVLCAFSERDINAVSELNNLIQKKVMYCLDHHRSVDIAVATREELLLLSEVCSLSDEFWESRLRVAFQLLFASIKVGARHPAISEHVILPCLKIISQACTPPKSDAADKDQSIVKSSKEESSSGLSGGATNSSKSTVEALEKNRVDSNKMHDIQLVSYSEWEKGASYLDFVRRQYKVSQAVKVAGQKSRAQRHDYLALKYALKWKRRAFKSKGGLATFELGSWVKELVLSACSQSIRSEMCMLISLLCGQSSSRRFRLLNLLMGLLPATLSVGESAAEYFELLFKMIDSEDARLFLTVRGCLASICKLIAREVENVEALERSLHIDISQGFILHKLIELLGKFLEVPNIRSRFMRDNLLSEVLEALIVIRSLIVQKTKLICDCNRLLKDLLDSLLLESSENKRQFIRACISGLQIHGEEKKGRTCLFILEQLCNLICPSKPESVYLLVLNKAHTQEEFIRGSMTKNPYSSSEIGPLMRDVKNKICHELDLIGLLEDDYSMELLVAGNIISLDLSVAQVYEQVWKKSSSQSSSALSAATLLSAASSTTSRESPPMNVTYRLQGLDGEATEPMIKELEEDREESQDPEVEFAIAGAVREYGGLEIILYIIQRLRDNFKSNHEQLVAVLNLLMHCCKIKENRRALLKLGALGLLLETARRAFSVEAMEPAEGILLIVESLTLEANESDDISITGSVLTVNSEETGTGEQAKKIVLMFLERLCHPLGKKSNKQQRNTEMVARILPYLTYGEPAAMSALVEHFDPYLQDWKAFDSLQKQLEDDNMAQQATKQRLMVENFVRVSESLKTSYCGGRLKDMIHEKGIIGVAVGHLRESFPVGFKSSSEWASALKLPSVPLILSLLEGLSMGHLPTQKCIDEGGVLPLLHALEGVSGENEIGARAENLLDTLANKDGNGDGFLEEKVRSLRHATRDEMRRLALKKREQLLQGLGMRQEFASDGGERIVVSRPILEGLDDVEEEEEDGVACMVCREGYGLRPTDLLGVYSYSKRVNLGASTSGSTRGEYVYTTVSSFNVIHFQCHLEAKRADAALKNPKKEWEGATLRNNESLCNSLFPLRGPSVPLLQYVRFVDQYWDNLNALGRAEGTRLRLLTYDIVLMLARFATRASFSAESRGGGRESNSKFLPFMIQMARHLLDQGSSSQSRTMANAVATYLSSSSSSETRPSTPPGGFQQPSPGSSSSSSEETVQFMMVNSLLSESYESWAQHRCTFLQRGIYHAYMQHTHGRAAARGSQTNDEELLSIVKSMLVYTGLIEQLQRFLKKAPPASSSSSSSVVGGELERWEVSMKERLVNMKEMVGFSKELLTWLDEMNSVDDLQEAFDVIGCLADVLSGGSTRCVDFVNAAINAGGKGS